MTELKLNTELLKAWLASRHDGSKKGPAVGEWDTDHWLCTLDGCSAHIIPKEKLHLDLSRWGEKAQFRCSSFHPHKSSQCELRFTGRCLEISDKKGKPGMTRVYVPADKPDAPGHRVYLDARLVAGFEDENIVRMTTALPDPAACAPVYLYNTADACAEPCGLVMPINPKTIEVQTKEEPHNV